MKNLIGLSVLFISVFLFSCGNCDCGENGECIVDACICDSGYEGDNCELEARTKYYGTYAGSITCDSQSPEDTQITIAAGPNLNQILTFDPADPTEVDTVTLVENIGTAPPYTFEVSGVESTVNNRTLTFLSESTFDFTTTITTFGIAVECTGNFIKQ